MKVTTLQNLLIEELKDLYSAEKQLSKAMPKMSKKASSTKLKKAIDKHHGETEKQIERLEQVFELLGEKPRAKKCLAMEGLLNEAQELMKEDMEPDVLDAALIAAAQKIEHYEMASYGTVRTYANLLGNTKAAKLLQKTLDEEGKTDHALTTLAESSINIEAINEEKGDTASRNGSRSKGRTTSGNGSAATAKSSSDGTTSAKKKLRSTRRKPAPTRTEDVENYETMMAEGTTTGVTRDTIGNDAQNTIAGSRFNRRRETVAPDDVERVQRDEDKEQKRTRS